MKDTIIQVLMLFALILCLFLGGYWAVMFLLRGQWIKGAILGSILATALLWGAT